MSTILMLLPNAGVTPWLAAVHQAGLAALTYTPSPMRFLSDILKRPPNEKSFLIIPMGYPTENYRVPDLPHAFSPADGGAAQNTGGDGGVFGGIVASFKLAPLLCAALLEPTPLTHAYA